MQASNGNRTKKAEKYAKLSIEQGSLSGISFLGTLYDEQGNTKLAEKYWIQAADKGEQTSMINLITWYEETNKPKLKEKYEKMLNKK